MRTCRACGVRKAESHYSGDSTSCKRCDPSPAPRAMYEIELDAIRDICAAVERLPPDGQRRALEFVALRYVAPVQTEIAL